MPGVWLALAMLFSIVFRSTATAALVSLGVWLFLALLWPALAQLVGEVIAPSDIRFAQLGLPTPDTVAWQQGLSRLSPGTLYGEAVVAMLSPEAQSLTNLLAQFQGRIMGAPLPFGQSVLSAWPQMVEPDRRHDPALRGGLRRVPAARGARLARRAHLKHETAGPGEPGPAVFISSDRQTVMTATILSVPGSTMMMSSPCTKYM